MSNLLTPRWRGRSLSDIARIVCGAQWSKIARAFARNMGNRLLWLVLYCPLNYYMSRKRRCSFIRHLKNPDRILIIILNKGIGEAVLYLPLLKGLRKEYKNSHITLITVPQANQIISSNIRLDETLLYHDRRRDYWTLLRKVRNRYDLAIDLLCSNRIPTGLLSFLSGAKCLVGADCGAHGLFFNIKIPVDYSRHITDFFSDILKALDIGGGYPTLDLRVENEVLASVASLLRVNDTEDNDFLICVHPSARDAVDILDKRWPLENYQILCQELVRRYRVKVIIIGSENERRLCERIQQVAPEEIICLAGKTSLRQLPALIKRCDLFIGNNSGPLHIATAVDTPSISLSGGVNISRWAPYGDHEKHRVIMERPGRKATPGIILETVELRRKLYQSSLCLKADSWGDRPVAPTGTLMT